MARRKKQHFNQPLEVAKSCGKNRYKSKAEADTVAREQELARLDFSLELKSYHCMFCGGWHLTKKHF